MSAQLVSTVSPRFLYRFPWDNGVVAPYPKEKLDILVPKISEWPGLVWQHADDGCHARALFIADLLHRSGVPLRNISYILGGSASSILNSSRIAGGQMQHIAVTVNGFVVDCLIDRAQAIPESSWLSDMGVCTDCFEKMLCSDDFLIPYKSKETSLLGCSEFTFVRVPVSQSCGFVMKPMCDAEGESILDPDGYPTFGEMEVITKPWTVEKERDYLEELQGFYERKLGSYPSCLEDSGSSAQSLPQLPPGAPKITAFPV